ncbi:MAG: hypothetical protein KJ709_06745 [Nanoarchaeota archaeon]|nr:hypothetical protein [Nanoarchaeota archaeon]
MPDYWFTPRTRPNFGWMPSCWQGIFLYILLFLIIFYLGWYFNLLDASPNQGFAFILTLILSLLSFAYIADKKTKEPVIFRRSSYCFKL